MAGGRLAKDVQYLQRHIDAQTNGQAKVTDVDDNLQFLMLDLLPNDGFYEGARLRFKVFFSESYPEIGPRVMCLDHVYHPNIDPSAFVDSEQDEDGSNVCVSLLDEWDSEMNLDHMVMALLFLLYNPNAGDALSPYFEGDMEKEELEKNIRLTLRGENFEGMDWPCLLVNGGEDGEGVKEGCEESSTQAEHTEGVASAESENVVKSAASIESLECAPVPEQKTCDVNQSVDAFIAGTSNDCNMLESSEDTVILNRQNSVLRDMTDIAANMKIVVSFKDLAVICTDEGDCEGREVTNIGECVRVRQGVSCARLPSMFKALFSCFHRRHAPAHFQTPGAATLADLGDCEVD